MPVARARARACDSVYHDRNSDLAGAERPPFLPAVLDFGRVAYLLPLTCLPPHTDTRDTREWHARRALASSRRRRTSSLRGIEITFPLSAPASGQGTRRPLLCTRARALSSGSIRFSDSIRIAGAKPAIYVGGGAESTNVLKSKVPIIVENDRSEGRGASDR